MQQKSKDSLKFFVRFTIASGFFIWGLVSSNNYYFYEYPLFGIRFLAEVLIAGLGALFGFYVIPDAFFKTKHWVENLIVTTVQKAVGDFWGQYMGIMDSRRKGRKREKKKKVKNKLKDRLKGGVLLDTSVLIDGRIVDLAKTGFLPNPLAIPKSVVAELHLLSDNAGKRKRKKGRRGLDIINDLKKATKTIIFDHKFTTNEVDKELLNLAKTYNVKIMTLDFNLNKVAKTMNVTVLNINDLVNAVKPVFIPGDKLTIEIAHIGKEKDQGVGYLEDGTMLVVSKANKLIGKKVDVEVSKLIQTPAGKMVFCVLR